MEPLSDSQLRDLLRQWEAPEAPAHLERRIFEKPPQRAWHRWLLAGSIRVPVPALVLLLLVVTALVYVVPRGRQASPAFVREVSLSDFRPVTELKPRIIRSVHAND